MSRIYPAKLLLFGEYTVLHGSQALAVPLHHWSGHWEKFQAADPPKPSPYFEWLMQKGLISKMIFEKMESDLSEGWSFVSDMPWGYGVGSSGAYVAALYDRYVADDQPTAKMGASDFLARMESYFHGTSSGMDPLVSYMDQAVLKDPAGVFSCISDPGWPQGWNIYLLDSGAGRTTGSLVNDYKQWMEREDFRRSIHRELIPVVEHAIHFYLLGVDAMLADCLAVISGYQREYFEPMILGSVRDKWDQLSARPGVHVKLCGAGGGGYYLVIDTIGHLSPDEPLVLVQRQERQKTS